MDGQHGMENCLRFPIRKWGSSAFGREGTRWGMVRNGRGDGTIYSKTIIGSDLIFNSNCTKHVWRSGYARTAGGAQVLPVPLTAVSVATNLIANGFNHKSQNELADGSIKQEKRDRLTESRNIFVLTICKTILCF